MNKTIRPVKRIRGTITVPGDKSVSHRALLLGSLAAGKTVISNLSTGKDVASTASCLRKLGIVIETVNDQILVEGKGINGFTAPSDILDAGNSGTTIRLLSGILAAQPFSTRITGDASLRRRPMERIINPLRLMGAEIETESGGVPPLLIHGSMLRGIAYTLPVASAQIKSCILLAALCASGMTQINEPAKSRDHTERMLPQFGVKVDVKDLYISIKGPASLFPCRLDIPGDLSSAAFFIAAATLVQNSELRIENIGMNPTRTGLIGVLNNMGGHIQEYNPKTLHGEPRADLHISPGDLKGIEISGKMIPLLIDEIPILAVLATQAKGKTIIRDAKELRIKETDRIAALTENLRLMGIKINVFDDGFSLEGPQKLNGADIHSRDDHRIAMAFTVAGLIAKSETRILHSECVDISYPGFYQTLEKIIHD